MRVFIYACDNIYGGLHGMEDFGVYEVSSVEEANDIGREMSYGVIDSYSDIGDTLEENAREAVELYDFGFDEAYADEMAADLSWYCRKIDEEKARGLSTEGLNDIAAKEGADYFCDNYCGEEYEDE